MDSGLKAKRLKGILELAEEAFSESRLARHKKDPAGFFEKEGWQWEEEARDQLWNQLWAEEIEKYCKGSFILDVGAGRGQLLKRLSHPKKWALEPALGCHQALRENGFVLIADSLLQWKESGGVGPVDHVLCCRSLSAAALHQGEFCLWEALEFMLELAGESLEIILRPRKKGENTRDSGLWPVLLLAEMGYTPELKWLDLGEEECAWIRVITTSLK